MRAYCPRCKTALPLDGDAASLHLTCPGCGLEFDLGEPTVTVAPDRSSAEMALSPGLHDSDYQPATPSEIAEVKRGLGDETQELTEAAAPSSREELGVAEGDTVGAYRVKRLLGRGGMGAVFLAEQLSLGRRVALKVLSPKLSEDPHFVERFNQEARVLARLSHPNVVGVIDGGTHEGAPYLVMEYVDGVSLRALMASEKLSARQALEIVPQICEALAYAHQHGVVHRDIKPENILLDKQGRVRLADFGLARLVDPTLTRITRTNMIMGSPDYMAPEQRESTKDVDHRADLFSLGVVFYEMLTGELPLGRFKLPSQMQLGLDIKLDEIVLKVLEKDPELRYQQASEVKTDVECVKQEVATARTSFELVAGPTEPMAPRPALSPRQTWVSGILAALAALGLLAAVKASPGFFAAGAAVLVAYGVAAGWLYRIRVLGERRGLGVSLGVAAPLVLYGILAGMNGGGALMLALAIAVPVWVASDVRPALFFATGRPASPSLLRRGELWLLAAIVATPFVRTERPGMALAAGLGLLTCLGLAAARRRVTGNAAISRRFRQVSLAVAGPLALLVTLGTVGAPASEAVGGSLIGGFLVGLLVALGLAPVRKTTAGEFPEARTSWLAWLSLLGAVGLFVLTVGALAMYWTFRSPEGFELVLREQLAAHGADAVALGLLQLDPAAITVQLRVAQWVVLGSAALIGVANVVLFFAIRPPRKRGRLLVGLAVGLYLACTLGWSAAVSNALQYLGTWRYTVEQVDGERNITHVLTTLADKGALEHRPKEGYHVGWLPHADPRTPLLTLRVAGALPDAQGLEFLFQVAFEGDEPVHRALAYLELGRLLHRLNTTPGASLPAERTEDVERLFGAWRDEPDDGARQAAVAAAELAGRSGSELHRALLAKQRAMARMDAEPSDETPRVDQARVKRLVTGVVPDFFQRYPLEED